MIFEIIDKAYSFPEPFWIGVAVGVFLYSLADVISQILLPPKCIVCGAKEIL